jgi:hypothetical protein
MLLWTRSRPESLLLTLPSDPDIRVDESIDGDLADDVSGSLLAAHEATNAKEIQVANRRFRHIAKSIAQRSIDVSLSAARAVRVTASARAANVTARGG